MKISAITLSLAAVVAARCQTDIELIKEGEGLNKCAYTDTTGHKTVCYGFNLDTGSAKSRISAVGGDFDVV